MIINIRKYEDSDLLSLAQVYKSSILHLGNQYYSEKQIMAWSGFADDKKSFEQWISKAVTYVAVNGSRKRLGFGGIEGSRRISALFVSPQAMRKGVGTTLLNRLISIIKTRGFVEATTEASEFSRPLFEKCGFTVTNVEVTSFRGVTFMRYAMTLRFDKPQAHQSPHRT
jgi:putative acetyltransferase